MNFSGTNPKNVESKKSDQGKKAFKNEEVKKEEFKNVFDSDSDSDDLFTSKPSKPKQKSKKNTQEMSKNDTPDQQTSDIPEISSVEPIIVKPPIKKTKLFDQSSDEDDEHQYFEKSVKQKDSPDSISNKVPEPKGKIMDFLKLSFSIYFGKVVPQKAC